MKPYRITITFESCSNIAELLYNLFAKRPGEQIAKRRTKKAQPAFSKPQIRLLKPHN